MAKEEKSVNFTKENIIREARAEVAKDVAEKHKAKYKAKLRELDAAQQVVRNIQRELEDLELQMETDLG